MVASFGILFHCGCSEWPLLQCEKADEAAQRAPLLGVDPPPQQRHSFASSGLKYAGSVPLG